MSHPSEKEKKNRNIFKGPLTSGKMLLNKIKPSGEINGRNTV